MTNDIQKTSDISWLKLGLPETPPEVEEVFSITRERIGYVRTAQQVTAQMPAMLAAQDGLSRALMVGDASPLPPKERELIALVVSVENGCIACIFGHASRLRTITGDALWVGEVEANYRHARLSAREMAIADYATKLTRAPVDMREADLAPLRAAGLSEIEILHVAGVTAFYNMSNRINSGLGVQANEEAYLAGR